MRVNQKLTLPPCRIRWRHIRWNIAPDYGLLAPVCCGTLLGRFVAGVRSEQLRVRLSAMDWMALSPEEWTAVKLSLRVAVVATLFSLPFGIAIAMALAR